MKKRRRNMAAVAECINLVTTAKFLGFAPQHLFYLVEMGERQYTSVKIPKRSCPNDFREISIPSSELKGVQRAINKLILKEFQVSDQTHSYVPGRSILTACNLMSGGKATLVLDIKDFFPSITFRRVFGLLRSEGFNKEAAYILSKLMVKGDCVAQGAPTSPSLSNLILRSMDRALYQLSQKWELEYLRYSDDLFFFKPRNFHWKRLAAISEDIVEKNGFNVNSAKTKFHPKGKPRITLGLLTAGETPAIPGPQRKIYRAAFHKAARDPHWGYRNKMELKGMLEWYGSVHGKSGSYLRYKAAYDNIGRIFIHDVYKSG